MTFRFPPSSLDRCYPQAALIRRQLPFATRAIIGLWLFGLICGVGWTYDYSEPMRCVQALPIGYPESPFVLRFTPEELAAQPVWSDRIEAIVIAGNASAPIRTGAEALRFALVKLGLSNGALVELDPDQKTLPATLPRGRIIVLGVPGRFALVSTLAEQAGLQVTDEALNGDGFVIKPIRQDRREMLLVTSPVDRGVLYGAHELEERSSRRGVPRIDQSFVPSIRYRGWPMMVFVDEPPDVIGRWRLNMSMATDWGGGSTKELLRYREFPELGGEKREEQILGQQRRLHAKYANAIKQGAMPAITWNPLSFNFAPGREATQAYRDAIARAHPGILAEPFGDHLAHELGNDRRNLCPSHPATRLFVESAVKEFVETFPEIEILHFMLSDVGGELVCGCDRCKEYPYLQRITDYSELIIRTARAVKPSIRFMTCPAALQHFIPIHHPEFHGDMVAVLKELKRRLGPDVEAFFLSMGSPPGGDCQSWLAPDSAILGQGVPVIFFFQHYEADGPGIASPVSPILSHLSWSLPIHLQTLRRYVRNGMIGGMLQGAGVEVGCWHPDLDGNRYMQNWCRAKYGTTAGQKVFKALQGTHKITEAFYLETKPDCIESVDFFRWGEYLKPWATDMSALKRAGLTEEEVAGVARWITLAFTMPQAPQPKDLCLVNSMTQQSWLKRFAIEEEIAIADRSAQLLAEAAHEAPGEAEIQHLHELAIATQALARLHRDYHQALVYASTARNTVDPDLRRDQVALARRHLTFAIEQVVNYRNHFLPLVRSQNRALWSLHLNAPRKYLGNILAIVREAVYLFGQEFGDETILGYMDRKISVIRSD
ncbi:MAG: hypothetical protein K1X42_04890 [Opitutaceae bacterium]|nr:hypothetical protein [Opitutaceae bacterium]